MPTKQRKTTKTIDHSIWHTDENGITGTLHT